MALGGLGRAHGEGLLELAGGGAFAEGRGDAGRREVPEMGRERGERGALAEGGGGPCEAWGSAAARGGGAHLEPCPGCASARSPAGMRPAAWRCLGGGAQLAGGTSGGGGGWVSGEWRSGRGRRKEAASSILRFHLHSAHLPLHPRHRPPRTMAYVAVAKALYDYQPQDPDTELAFHEDHILYIIDKEDNE